MPGPLHFGDPQAEFEAGRTTAAAFDVSDRSQIEVRGADRAAFLHSFCTNDVKRLSPGEYCEAFVPNVKGKVLGHVFVFVEPEAIWIESVAGADAALIEHLDRYLITEDVQLRARTAELGEFFVTGPRAAAVRNDRLQSVESVTDIRIHCIDWFNQPGFLIAFPRVQAAALWQRISESDDCRPAGSLAFEALRIDAGFPLYGRDVSDDNLAQERAGRPARFRSPRAAIWVRNRSRELTRSATSTGNCDDCDSNRDRPRPTVQRFLPPTRRRSAASRRRCN